MDIIKKFEPLFGDWYAKRFIGAGSCGRVYEIYRKELGVEFCSALKYISLPADMGEIEQLRADGMDDDSVKEYYDGLAKYIFSEITMMDKLRGNTNIVSFEDSRVVPKPGGVGYDIFIRMELLESLTARMGRKPLTRDETVELGIDICSALERCRRENIIHRDVKPDNIFVSRAGDFKLGDFGIARTLEKSAAFMSKKGTYNYMAPEVYKGEKYGATCDIYSLGLVMYRLLNGGRLPFLPQAPARYTAVEREESLLRRIGGEPLPAPSGADPELAAIVLKACAYDPGQRFAEPDELLNALISVRGKKASESAAAVTEYDPSDEMTAGYEQNDAFAPPENELDATQGAERAKAIPDRENTASALTGLKPADKEKAAEKETEPEPSPASDTADGREALSFDKEPASEPYNTKEETEEGKNTVEPSEKSATTDGNKGKKKKKLWLIAGIAAGLVLVIGILAAVGVLNMCISEKQASPSPRDRVIHFADPAFESAFREKYHYNDKTIRESELLGFTELCLDQYGLTDISDVAKFKNLTKLYLYSNKISDISPLAGLTELKELYLSNNNISDIAPLAGLTELRELDLRSNSIEDISPLAGLTNLTWLDLHSNNISDISPLAGLTELKKLYLYRNNISDISPLTGLTKLESLMLGGNHITEEQIIRLRRRLGSDCDITF